MYSREIDGRTLTLVPSGWTYARTFVLYDRETGSLWYPAEEGLMGIQGVYFERRLPRLASDDTRWRVRPNIRNRRLWTDGRGQRAED